MSDKSALISNAFQTFASEAPRQAQVWLAAGQNLGAASALDRKTTTLAYLSVLAVLNRDAGLPYHAAAAKEAGASRDEVISAILLGLPAAGHGVVRALPIALAAYDAELPHDG